MLLAVAPLAAQQIPVLNHYVYNRYLYNPASVGTGQYMTAGLTHRQQWSNMPDAPVTSLLTMDVPMYKSNIGIGGTLLFDQAHLTSRSGAYVSFAYKLKFNKKATHYISIGASGGVINQRFRFADATVVNPNDPAIFNQNSNRFYFDASAGVEYRANGFRLGVSIPQIAASSLRYNASENVQFKDVRHFLGTASYRFGFGKSKALALEPVVLARYIPSLPFQVEGQLMVDWKEIVWLTGGYRMADASNVSAGIGVRIRQSLGLAYTVELNTGSNQNSGLGQTHEISVSYRFGAGKTRINDIDMKVDSLSDDIKRTRGRIKKVEERLDGVEEINNQQDERLDKHRQDINELQNLKNENAKLQQEMKELREKLTNNEQKGDALEYKKLGSVKFKRSASNLDAAAIKALDAVVEAYQADKTLVVYVAGFASSEGDFEYNLSLSLRRANEVRDYLLDNGFDTNRVLILPQGEVKDVEATRADNRRCDIFVTVRK